MEEGEVCVSWSLVQTIVGVEYSLTNK
jgi:hypothetical protein